MAEKQGYLRALAAEWFPERNPDEIPAEEFFERYRHCEGIHGSSIDRLIEEHSGRTLQDFISVMEAVENGRSLD
jgi:hypothetical protein